MSLRLGRRLGRGRQLQRDHGLGHDRDGRTRRLGRRSDGVVFVDPTSFGHDLRRPQQCRPGGRGAGLYGHHGGRADPSRRGPRGGPDQSAAAIPAVANTTYDIQVDAASGSSGPSSSAIQPNPGTPANDNLINATTLNEAINDAIAGTGSNPVATGTTEARQPSRENRRTRSFSSGTHGRPRAANRPGPT